MEIVIWAAFCIWVAVAASKKGRSGIGWFCLAFLFSPILAGVALAMVKDLKIIDDLNRVKTENQNLKDRVVTNEKLTDYRLNRAESDINRLSDARSGFTISSSDSQTKLIAGETKLCGACKEVIKAGAIKCKHCGTMQEKEVAVECEYCKEIIMSTDTICEYCKSPVVATASPKQA